MAKGSVFFLLVCAELAIIWLTFIIYGARPTGGGLGYEPSPIEFTIAVSTLAVSMIGAVGVGLTLYLQLQNSRHQQEQLNRNFDLAQYGYNFQLFTHIENFFLSDKYFDCRESVWDFWKDYNSFDKDARDAIDGKLRKLLSESMYDHWTPAGFELYQSQDGQRFKQVFKLLRYFDVMSNFELADRPTAAAFHFYYAYYRRLIWTIAELFKDEYAAQLQGDRAQQLLPKHTWHDLIQRMDKKMMQFGLELPPLSRS